MGSPESIGRAMVLGPGSSKYSDSVPAQPYLRKKKARSGERALRILSETRAGT